MKRILYILTFVSLVACLRRQGSQTEAVPEAENKTETSPAETPLPEEEIPDDMFTREFNQISFLPFSLRNLKLEQWLPTGEQAERARARGEAQFEELGGQNYANGRPEAVILGKQLLEKWLLHVQVFCSENQTREHFAGKGLTGLFTSVYGREPAADEMEDLAALEGDAGLSETEKFTVACMAFLGSLEFISQ